jgi:Polysaccharide lyase
VPRFPRIPLTLLATLATLLVVGATVGGGSSAAQPPPHRAVGGRTVDLAEARRVLPHRRRTTAVSSPTPGPPLIFDGSFGNELKNWYSQAISSRVSTVPDTGPGGGEAARFEVRDGDVEPQTGSQRAELVAPMFFDEGQDLYIHDEIRVPSGNTFDAPWQIIQQLHEDSSENSPGVAVFLENDHSLRISSGDSSIPYWDGPVLQTDRWYDLTYRVLLSQNENVGTIEVWLDGVPQRLANGATAIHGPTATARRTFFKTGIYRSRESTGTSVVEHGDLMIGSSLAAVEGSS